MTEFWVSQGQHWCEYCRVWMAKNVATIRHHEMGQGHKAAVAAKLKKLQHDASAQERERRQAEATMGHIEEMAKRQFEKDMAEQQQAARQQAQQQAPRQAGGKAGGALEALDGTQRAAPSARESTLAGSSEGWAFDSVSGYLYNAGTGFYHDPETSLYFSDTVGNWMTQSEMLQAVARQSSQGGPPSLKSGPQAPAGPSLQGDPRAQVPTPGKLVLASQMRDKARGNAADPVRQNAAGVAVETAGKGVRKGGEKVGTKLSSVAVNKKRKTGSALSPVSAEEAAALAKREAARRRMEEREKKLGGLYSDFK